MQDIFSSMSFIIYETDMISDHRNIGQKPFLVWMSYIYLDMGNNNPFGNDNPFDREDFETIFEELLGGIGGGTEMSGTPVSTIEEDSEFIATIDVPGFTKDEISVRAGNGAVVVKGETRGLHQQRRVQQRIPLPDDAVVGESTAEYKNGVLTLRFPLEKDDDNSGIDIEIK